MSRLIDAGKLQMELLMSRQAHSQNERENQLMERDAIIVQEQPTVDAVEVVRCKDCKLHRYCVLENDRLFIHGGTGFCADGERGAE